MGGRVCGAAFRRAVVCWRRGATWKVTKEMTLETKPLAIHSRPETVKPAISTSFEYSFLNRITCADGGAR